MFVLQGVFMSLILIPFVVHIGTGVSTIWPLALLGFFIWCVGFYFQLTGDLQLKQFLQTRRKNQILMTKGVWSLTRHPNYFGEILIWIGMFTISINFVRREYLYFSILSSIYIFILLSPSGGFNNSKV